MEWNTPREQLMVKTGSINEKKGQDSDRQRLIKKFGSTCCYCGGRYTRYLLIVGDCDTSCHGCYVLTHINMGFTDEIEICISSVSQLEIVRKSVDFISNNNRVPNPVEIDKDVKKVDLSTYELSNAIINGYQLPDDLKLFFTDCFDFRFIDVNLFNQGGAKERKRDDLPIAGVSVNIKKNIRSYLRDRALDHRRDSLSDPR